MTIPIELKDVKRIFFILEELNDLFHQPLNYQDKQTVQQFANNHYEEIHDLYYNIVWDMLPQEEQRKIVDS